ncbi:Retrovirus-related Pol polyprotein, partial [Mucuna pruriens]
MNLTILDMVKKEVTKLLAVGIIYPISNSQWVSPVQVVHKKSGMTIMKNQHDELVPMRIQNSWQVYIDYRRLNQATPKDHFPLPFIYQVLEKLAGRSHYCFLNGFSGYMQIHIAPKDQHKTTFTCPFGLCNAPSTFQRCMTSIFLDLLQECMEVFMDDFTVYADLFDACLENLSKVLTRCIDTNLVLNFEKCHLMVTEGIVLGHMVSNRGIEVDKSKIDIITSLPNPTLDFTEDLLRTSARLPCPYPKCYKRMCDVSNSALEAVLGQRVGVGKPVHVIAYASRTMDPTQIEKEANPMLIRDEFPDEQLLHITTPTPWFVNICNFVAASQFPLEASRLCKERLQNDAKYYIWDDPYLWRLCNDQVIRKCILDIEINSVLQFCHGGSHNGSTRTARKVLDCGFYWPTIFKDAYQFVST